MLQDLLDLWKQRPEIAFYFAVAAAVICTVEAFGLVLARAHRNRSHINKRLQLLSESPDREETLVQLRRERGLTEDGSFSFKLVSLNRLLLQSGVGTRSVPLLALSAASFVLGATAGLWVSGNPVVVVGSACLVGVIVPLLYLRGMRKRRRAKFAEQFPEALDILVRSMRAGHPLPVAVSLVGREMPDPVGTEFGMCSDEMTYGLDLETALQNMSARVGQEDMPFVVVAVSIQSKTGGNLADVLSNLSRVIRDRFKLRRRVKAMSAEGRMSAAALSLIPLFVFVMLNLIAPAFYGGVKDEPIVVPVAIFTLSLWAAGIFTIHRLVNFKY